MSEKKQTGPVLKSGPGRETRPPGESHLTLRPHEMPNDHPRPLAGNRRRLRIAVDFDGVLFNHVPHMLRALRDQHNVDLLEEGLVHWDFMQYRCIQRAGLTFAHIKEVLNVIETDHDLHSAPLRDVDARRVMGAWRRAGHLVYIVTAREESSREATTHFLRHNRVPHDGLVMDAKVKAGYDLLVDDAPHNVRAASGSGGQAFLMDHPYNRLVPCDGNPRRVHTWREVGAVFHAMTHAVPPRSAPALARPTLSWATAASRGMA